MEHAQVSFLLSANFAEVRYRDIPLLKSMPLTAKKTRKVNKEKVGSYYCKNHMLIV